jgi:hypothetical protein
MRIGVANYPGGFASGIIIRGMPSVQTHPGKVFWVGNPSTLQLGEKIANDTVNRGTFLEPFSTIDFAIGQCLAGRGDIIFVKPGYTQTITLATEILMDVADVAIIGLGTGTSRPTITFGAAAATIKVAASNITVQNILHVANFADVASYYTATTAVVGKDFMLENCEFRDTASNKNALTVFTGNATAAANDGFTMERCRISALGTTAATTAIKPGAALDRVKIKDNYAVYAILNNTAALVAAGANNLTNLEISGNKVYRPNTDTSGGGIVLTSSSTASTGVVYDNYVATLDAAAIILATTGTKLGFFQNFVSGAADLSGFLLPAADTDA